MSLPRRVSLWIAVSVAAFAAGILIGRLSTGNRVTPAVRSGTLMLVTGDRTDFVVQPAGSHSTKQFSTPEMWIDPFGTIHDGDFPACINTTYYGQTIDYGVVTARPHGDAPGTDQIIWVRCLS